MLQDVARCCKAWSYHELSAKQFWCAFEGCDQGSISRCEQIFGGFLLLHTGRNNSNMKMWSKSVETLARWKSRKCIGLGWNLHRLFIRACSLHHKDAKLTPFSERSWMKVDYRLRLKRNGTLHWTGIVFHPFSLTLPPSASSASARRPQRLRLQRRFEFSQRAAVEHWWSRSGKPLTILAFLWSNRIRS